MDNEDLKTLTADIVSAFVSNNTVAVGDVPNLINSVHLALSTVGRAVESVPDEVTPAVSIRASVKPDALTCLECGAKLKTIRRHIGSAHGLSEADYRQRFNLPDTYPMVAPNYSAHRSAMAKEIGLGAKGRGGGRKPTRPAKETVRAIGRQTVTRTLTGAPKSL